MGTTRAGITERLMQGLGDVHLAQLPRNEQNQQQESDHGVGGSQDLLTQLTQATSGLRLRGNAKAMDIAKLCHDQTWLIREQAGQEYVGPLCIWDIAIVLN